MSVASPVLETPPLQAVMVRLELLEPSKTNPRKKFNQTSLEQLAASMAPPVGVLEPLVVRPLPAGRYEIIAGERRCRAAKIAGLAEVPVVVRHVTDAQVITLQLVENTNREDIHPLDEARAIEQLLKLSPRETPKTIASTIGMSERYVQNRLHYTRLAPGVQKAFGEDRITAGHADLLVRLKSEDQARALKACFTETFDYADQEGDAVSVEDSDGRKSHVQLVSVRELDRWIKGSVRLEVAPKAKELDFYPEVKQAVNDAAHVAPVGSTGAKGPASPAATLLQVTDSYEYWGKDKPAPLTRDNWEPIEKKKCPHVRRAVIVLGKGRGEVLDVCVRDSGCEVHFPRARHMDAGGSVAQSEQRKNRQPTKGELQRQAQMKRARRWGRIKKLAFAAVKVKVKGITLAKALPILNYGINRWDATAANATLEKLVVAAAENDMQFIREETFARHIGKPLGIDLKALERQAFPPKPPKGKAAKRGKPAPRAAIAKHLKKVLARDARKAPKKRKAGKKR